MLSMLLLSITLLDVINIVLVLIFVALGIQYFGTKWSYKISKPWSWEEGTVNHTLPAALVKIERTYRDKVRLYTFWLVNERLRQQQVPGAFAEVGVYQGETARILHHLDPSRRLHLFDTFAGFPEADLHNKPAAADEVDFNDTSADQVRSFIHGNENVIIHAGYFPDTAQELDEPAFALVHLDADLYQPTLAGLRYFYPRLSPLGAIIVHDYNHNWPGVRQAVDEFVKEIPESIMPIADWQGSIMITRNQSK
jgi:O-methyltransferase